MTEDKWKSSCVSFERGGVLRGRIKSVCPCKVAGGIQNPMLWTLKLESEFWFPLKKNPESSTWNLESTVRNQESKTVFDWLHGTKSWSNRYGQNFNAEGNLWENIDFCSSKDLELQLVQQCRAVLNSTAHILLLQCHSNVSWQSLTSWSLRFNFWFSKFLRIEYWVKVLHHIWLKLYVHLKHVLSI